jgi:hypothetical protein
MSRSVYMILAFAVLATVASHAESRKQGQARNVKIEMEFELAKLKMKNATFLKMSSSIFQSVVSSEYEVSQAESTSKRTPATAFSRTTPTAKPRIIMRSVKGILHRV